MTPLTTLRTLHTRMNLFASGKLRGFALDVEIPATTPAWTGKAADRRTDNAAVQLLRKYMA